MRNSGFIDRLVSRKNLRQNSQPDCCAEESQQLLGVSEPFR